MQTRVLAYGLDISYAFTNTYTYMQNAKGENNYIGVNI